MLEREIIITEDGSSTIYLPEWNEQYHSKHGAIQEAYHVFIEHGLYHFLDLEANQECHEKITIMEMGFGTGLNAFITLLEANKLNVSVNYVGIEAYPVSMVEILQLNYPDRLTTEKEKRFFNMLHDVSWEKQQTIIPNFTLLKQNRFFNDIIEKAVCNIIYFDAFGARVQPELWTEAMFKKMYEALKDEGVLVTYSAKGSVRRAMEVVGFKVERLPGPPGKREMLRGTKSIKHSDSLSKETVKPNTIV